MRGNYCAAATLLISVLLAPDAILSQSPPSPAPDTGLRRLKENGDALIKRGDLAGAEQVFRGALDQAHKESDRVSEAEFLRLIGETFERRWDYASARPFYEKALVIRRERNDGPQIALLQGGLSVACCANRRGPSQAARCWPSEIRWFPAKTVWWLRSAIMLNRCPTPGQRCMRSRSCSLTP